MSTGEVARQLSSSVLIAPRPLRDIAAEAVADIDNALKIFQDWGCEGPSGFEAPQGKDRPR